MISIIVPVYNVENYLETCLNSLIGQTYRDIEIICVDDGSQDKSGYILSDYAKKDSRIKVITQKNEGIASARNRGLKEVRGEWIMFVDSDDWIDATVCDKALSLATKHNSDVVLWSYTRELTTGKSTPRPLLNKDKLFDEKNIRSLHRQIVGPVDAELSDPSLLHSWGTVWGKLYSRDVIRKVQFTDIKIVGSAEDVLFNIEVFTHVKRAFYINEPMYHYRKTRRSLTGSYNKHLNERWINLYTEMQNVIASYNLSPDFYTALNSRIALGLIGQGLNECKSTLNPRSKIDKIRHIITQEHYQSAISELPLKYFPPHWYLFFWSAKNSKASILYILLAIMNRYFI